MGTTYSILIVPGPNEEVDLVKLQFGIDSVLHEVNSQMSTYIVNSEISQFNDLNTGESISISTGFKNVIQRSIYWGKISNGAFDPTVFPIVQLWRTGSRINKMDENWEPPKTEEILSKMNKVGYNKININGNTLSKAIEGQMIDLNAIAKGWGVDEIFRFLKKIGFENLMVEIGGEVRVGGKNNLNRPWSIGIETPIKNTLPGEQIFGKVDISNKGMATSGNYRNFYTYNGKSYSHIIDPRNGKSVESSLLSVTVLAESCMDADALATALSILSYDEGLKLIKSIEGSEALWILSDKLNDFIVKKTDNMPFFN